MNTKKIAAIVTLVAMVTNLSASTTSVLAHELTNKDEVTNTSSKINQMAQMKMTLKKSQNKMYRETLQIA